MNARHESVLNHSGARWLWISLALSLVSLLAYALHSPAVPPNGGTWLGYTLGTVAGLLILWLMYFGIRKRSYSGTSNLRGWLSAHIYLGTTLILIALLHAGFQVGWNLHTFFLVVMLLVIFSGFFGVYCYLRYPSLMTRNRESATRSAMLEEIAELDQNALALADGIDPKVHNIVLRSIQNTRLGGGVITQLRAHDDSDAALAGIRAALDAREKSQQAAGGAKSGQTIFAMVDFLASGTNDRQAEALRKLIDLLSRKKALASRVARDIQYQALMEIWLYFHVPLSFATVAALFAHVVSVFFYW